MNRRQFFESVAAIGAIAGAGRTVFGRGLQEAVTGDSRLPDGTASCPRGAPVGERLAMQAYYEAAREGDVTTRATAPSLSWQQSSSRNGSAIIREDWWSSSVIGLP